MYLIQRMEEMTVRTGDARKNVAEFVLREQEGVFDYSIDEIAGRCFTSKSTVTRFAKYLGFDGWRGFLKAFREELALKEQYKGTVDVNYPFDAGTPVRDIAENLLCVQMESLADTAGQVDYNAINRAVNYMVQADRIVLFARSPNHYLAGMFARKLLSLGCDAQLAPSGEAGLIAYGMGAGSCAILVSYSGHNPAQEPMSHVPVLKKNRVPVIAITSAGGNYLSGHADAILTVSSRERLYSKIAGFATEESIGYPLNLLYACYYARDYGKNRSFKEGSAKELEQKRTAVWKEQMER